MAEKNQKFFEALENLANLRKVDDYPSLESSDHKWYQRYELSPRERVEQRLRDEIQRFPQQLLDRYQVLDESGMLIANPDADIRKRLEAALNFWTFHSKKLGGDWTLPGDIEEGFDVFEAPKGVQINYRGDVDDPYSR